jgi:NAD(P)-dependent dehydrogenase (short-subunit alcohol dehydrogenase family)
MLARRKALLDELKRQIESAGARAFALGADVTHASEVRAAVDRTLETFGAIDILVNSAGRPDTGQGRIDGPGGPRASKTTSRSSPLPTQRRGSGMRPAALGTTRSRRLDPGEAEALEVEELNHAKSGVDLGWRS